MTDHQTTPRPYWERFVTSEGAWRHGAPLGAELAALRRGAGKEPGTVPPLWRFHSVDVSGGFDRPGSDRWDPPAALVAEHHALVLYGFHQQGEARPVHRPGALLGHAARGLHVRFAQDAVDKRFYATVTADGVGELAHHLRALVRLLRTLPAVAPLDYSVLSEDLRRWSRPELRGRVRRRWSAQYHSAPDDAAASVGGEATSA